MAGIIPEEEKHNMSDNEFQLTIHSSSTDIMPYNLKVPDGYYYIEKFVYEKQPDGSKKTVSTEYGKLAFDNKKEAYEHAKSMIKSSQGKCVGIKWGAPGDSDIVAKVLWPYMALCVFFCILIVFAYLYKDVFAPQIPYKFISLAGLMLDMIGITITFSEVSFFDVAGFRHPRLDKKREQAKKRKLRLGLVLILVGFTLQGLGVVYSSL